MTFVKICGITNLVDALVAIEYGADALGFNFYRPSPRFIQPALAREIIEQIPESVLTVGVFVNEAPEDLKAIAGEANVSGLQLHGDESPQYCAALEGWYVIKALNVSADFHEQKVSEYEVDAILLDASHPKLRGGTGQVADWSVARRANRMGRRILLAGGLSPGNIREAITDVNPYGIDACSGLEESPGIKDHDLLKLFMKAIREESPIS